MNRKAIFFDVDGTLIDYLGGMLYISDTTKEAINKIKNYGHLAILATGRPKSFLNTEILDLGFDVYITSNGAYIEMDGNEIYNRKIEGNRLKGIIEFFMGEDLEFVLEGQNNSYLKNLNTNAIKYFLKKFAIPDTNITDKWKVEEIDVNKMVVFIQQDRQLNVCKEFLEESFKFMNHPGLNSYDIYFKDCTKADAIRRIIKYLEIDIENTYAFGDGINDIEMFQTVKYGIAMGNANNFLKEVAYYVTDDVFSHGIYNGMKKLEII